LERLLQVAAGVRGKVLITLAYDAELARRLRETFTVRTVETKYSLASRGARKTVRELVVANYPLPRVR
jgi:hypothetical protein